MAPTLPHSIARFVTSLIGAAVLFSALAVLGYWIFAFLYFGARGSFAGLTEVSLTSVAPLRRLALRDGPLEFSDPRSVGFHALRAFGPGVFTLVPSYVLLRVVELIAPR